MPRKSGRLGGVAGSVVKYVMWLDNLMFECCFGVQMDGHAGWMATPSASVYYYPLV
jgi:hypothetical protein